MFTDVPETPRAPKRFPITGIQGHLVQKRNQPRHACRKLCGRDVASAQIHLVSLVNQSQQRLVFAYRRAGKFEEPLMIRRSGVRFAHGTFWSGIFSLCPIWVRAMVSRLYPWINCTHP